MIFRFDEQYNFKRFFARHGHAGLSHTGKQKQMNNCNCALSGSPDEAVFFFQREYIKTKLVDFLPRVHQFSFSCSSSFGISLHWKEEKKKMKHTARGHEIIQTFFSRSLALYLGASALVNSRGQWLFGCRGLFRRSPRLCC